MRCLIGCLRAKFGKGHQPLGYYRLNDESVSNIPGLLLAQQIERRLYDRKEFENIRQQSVAFKLLSIEDHHKFYVEDIEVYHGLKPKLPWMVHMQCSLLLQGQIHGLWQLPGLRECSQIRWPSVCQPKMPLAPRSP